MAAFRALAEAGFTGIPVLECHYGEWPDVAGLSIAGFWRPPRELAKRMSVV